jgi:hypothetical protein
MQTITDLKDLIKDLPTKAKVLVIIAGLATILAYSWINSPEETAPTVNKEATVGDISGGIGGDFQINQ